MNKLIIYIALGVLVLGGLFYFLKPQPAPVVNQDSSIKVFQLVVADRKLVAGPNVIQVNQGDSVTIGITADETNELHLHGYDLEVAFEKNSYSTISLVANLSGRFALELHEGKIEIGALEVLPK